MAKAFEVIGDVVSTLLGWLSKIGQIAGSIAGVVGRFIPGAGQFLNRACLTWFSESASRCVPRPDVSEPVMTPRPTLRT